MSDKYDNVFWEMRAPVEMANEQGNPVDLLAGHLKRMHIGFAVEEYRLSREGALADDDPSMREAIESPEYATSSGIVLFQFLTAESDCATLRAECEKWIRSLEEKTQQDNRSNNGADPTPLGCCMCEQHTARRKDPGRAESSL